jgi:hypothetical protein
MDERINVDRRRFLGSATLAIAAAQLGLCCETQANGEPRQLAAIGRATSWLKGRPLTAADLLGKVVLVDFCTYTCINWLRELPYVRAWADKYKHSLVVIGVHTPEFPFEHDIGNVRRALGQMRIDYPVVLDNDYAIWRAFDNHYWPALYFLDPRGRVRHSQFGEGNYEKSERFIQRMLKDAGDDAVLPALVDINHQGVEAPADWANLKSPENYVGYARTQNFASPGGAQRDRRRRYTAASRLSLNQWALEGEWTLGRQAIVSNATDARIVNRFHARDLHLVMGPSRPMGGRQGRLTVWTSTKTVTAASSNNACIS